MKRFVIAGVAASMFAGLALPAAAQYRDGPRQERREDRREVREDRREYRQDRREDRRDDRMDRRDDRRDYREARRDYRQGYRQAERRYRAGSYYAPRGYYVREWNVGQRLPRGYYGDRYVIRDHRSYGLYAPPRGYAWNRVGNDAVLIAITSGLIGAVVGGLFY